MAEPLVSKSPLTIGAVTISASSLIAALGWMGEKLISLDEDVTIRGVWVSGHGYGYASRSIDNGATWSALTRGLNSGETSEDILAVATDGNGVWAQVQENGYGSYSTNNGGGWSALVQACNSEQPRSSSYPGYPKMATDGNGLFVYGSGHGSSIKRSFAFSKDDITSWKNAPLSSNNAIGYITAIACGNGRVIYGTTDGTSRGTVI